MDNQNLQNVPFIPGQPIVVPTKTFTRETQESIIDNYFNGTGSVYANTTRHLYDRQPSQDPNLSIPVEEQQPPSSQMSADEIASLTKIKNMIDGDPTILTEIARREMGSHSQPNQAAPAAGLNTAATNTGQPNDPLNANYWDQMLSPQNAGGTPPTPNLSQNEFPSGQNESSQQSMPFSQSYNETLYAECLRNGYDYKQVSQLASEFMNNPSNIVDLYKSIQEVERQQANQPSRREASTPPPIAAPPRNLSEAPIPNHVQVLATPAFGRSGTNPYFR